MFCLWNDTNCDALVVQLVTLELNNPINLDPAQKAALLKDAPSVTEWLRQHTAVRPKAIRTLNLIVVNRAFSAGAAF